MRIGITPRQCIDCGAVEMTTETHASLPVFRCDKCLERIAMAQPPPPPEFPFAQEKPKVVKVL